MTSNTMRNPIKHFFEIRAYSFLWMLIQRTLWSSAQLITPPIQVTQVLWALGPCQSAFWIPNSSSEFNSNWITYLFEGNPISRTGDCLFTLESDPNTRIEMVIQEVNLFGSSSIQPPPCLTLYDVKQNGSIVMLKRECQAMLMNNALESQPTFTETNLAVISTTIRYGSFQLQARAVPKTYGFPTRVSSSTTSTTAILPSVATVSSNNLTISMTLPNATATTASVTSPSSAAIVTPSSNSQLMSDMFRYDFGNRKSAHNFYV